jgi:transposase
MGRLAPRSPSKFQTSVCHIRVTPKVVPECREGQVLNPGAHHTIIWGKDMKEPFLTEIEMIRIALAEELKGTADARFLHRLHCVLLVVLGHCAKEVAVWFFNDPSTVARWVRHFKRFGVEGLREEKRTGRPAALDRQRRLELSEVIGQPPMAYGFTDAKRWNGKLVAAYLKSRYQLVFSVRQCQRLLRQLRTEASSTDAPPASEEPEPVSILAMAGNKIA